jgi:hypothetical protein
VTERHVGETARYSAGSGRLHGNTGDHDWQRTKMWIENVAIVLMFELHLQEFSIILKVNVMAFEP